MEFKNLIHYLALNPDMCIRVYRGRDGMETVQLARIGGEWNYDVVIVTEYSLETFDYYAKEHMKEIEG